MTVVRESTLHLANDRRSAAAGSPQGDGNMANVDLRARILIVEDEVMIA